MLAVFPEFVGFPAFVVFPELVVLPELVVFAARFPGMRTIDQGLGLQKDIAGLNIRAVCNLRCGKAEKFVVGD